MRGIYCSTFPIAAFVVAVKVVKLHSHEWFRTFLARNKYAITIIRTMLQDVTQVNSVRFWVEHIKIPQGVYQRKPSWHTWYRWDIEGTQCTKCQGTQGYKKLEQETSGGTNWLYSDCEIRSYLSPDGMRSILLFLIQGAYGKIACVALNILL